MPGVIGASIFSPRPARGYRFHSLQVEIIIVLLRPRKAQSFSEIRLRRRSILYRNLNVLLQKSFLSLLSESTYRELAGRSPTRQANPPQIGRKCCSSAALAGA